MGIVLSLWQDESISTRMHGAEQQDSVTLQVCFWSPSVRLVVCESRCKYCYASFAIRKLGLKEKKKLCK